MDRDVERGLLGAAGVYGAVVGGTHALKHTPITRMLSALPERRSTLIEDFYSKGAKKGRLFLGHMLNNWRNEVQTFIKNNPDEFPKGMSDSAKIKYTEKIMRDWGHTTPAELNHAANQIKIEQAAEFAELKGEKPKRFGLGKYKRLGRHEILKNQLVRYTMGNKYSGSLMVEKGLSRPTRTDVKTIFKGHEGAINKWGLSGDAKASVSNILNVGGDKSQLIKAARKDHMFKMADKVLRSGVDLHDLDAVRGQAENRIGQMGTRLRGVNRLHANVGSREKEVSKFMKNFSVGKNGELVLNYSSAYKPHYLVGGTNVNIKLWKGPRGGFLHDILVSDKYDVLKSSHVQRNQHFNVARSTNASKMKKVRTYARKSLRSRFLAALKANDLKEARRLALKLGIKGAKFLGRKALLKI